MLITAPPRRACTAVLPPARPKAAMAMSLPVPGWHSSSPVSQVEQGRTMTCSDNMSNRKGHNQREFFLCQSLFRSLIFSPTKSTLAISTPRHSCLLPPHRFPKVCVVVSADRSEIQKSPYIFSGILGFIWGKSSRTCIGSPSYLTI